MYPSSSRYLVIFILCRAMMPRARPMKLYKVRTLALHLSDMLLQKRTISRYVLASLQWPAMAPWNEAEAKPRRFPHYCRPSYKLLWLAQRPTPLQYGREGSSVEKETDWRTWAYGIVMQRSRSSVSFVEGCIGDSGKEHFVLSSYLTILVAKYPTPATCISPRNQ